MIDRQDKHKKSGTSLDDVPAVDTMPDQKILQLPIKSGTALYREIWRHPIQGEKLYYHPDRLTVYELRNPSAQRQDNISEPRPDQDSHSEAMQEKGMRFVPFRNGDSIPILDAIIGYPKEESEKGEEYRYLITWDGITHECSWTDVKDGSCWRFWPTKILLKRADYSLYQAILIDQCNHWQIPRIQGAMRNGWIQRSNGQSGYAIPTGEIWGETGKIADENNMHLAIPETDARYFRAVSIDPDPLAISHMLQVLGRTSDKGITPLILLAGIRALFHMPDRFAPGFFVFLVGQSGSMKTTVANLARCLIGDYWRYSGNGYPGINARADDTITAIEEKFNRLAAMAVIFDDLRDNTKDAALKTDRIARAAADGVPPRERSNMSRYVSRKVQNIPFVTGELIPEGLGESVINRSLTFRFGPDMIHKEAIRELYRDHHAAIAGLGYGMISYFAQRLNAEGDTFLETLHNDRDDYASAIANEVKALINDPAYAASIERIANAAGQIMITWDLVATYCNARGIALPFDHGQVRSWLVAIVHDTATLARKEAGRKMIDVLPFDQWVLWAIRQILRNGKAHLTDREGNGSFTPSTNIGYRRDSHGSEYPQGDELGEIDDHYVYLQIEPLADLLNDQARIDHRSLMPARDITRELSEAGYSVKGEGDHPYTRITRIKGDKRQWRIQIPIKTLWSDNDAPDGDVPPDPATLISPAPLSEATIPQQNPTASASIAIPSAPIDIVYPDGKICNNCGFMGRFIPALTPPHMAICPRCSTIYPDLKPIARERTRTIHRSAPLALVIEDDNQDREDTTPASLPVPAPAPSPASAPAQTTRASGSRRSFDGIGVITLDSVTDKDGTTPIEAPITHITDIARIAIASGYGSVWVCMDLGDDAFTPQEGWKFFTAQGQDVRALVNVDRAPDTYIPDPGIRIHLNLDRWGIDPDTDPAMIEKSIRCYEYLIDAKIDTSPGNTGLALFKRLTDKKPTRSTWLRSLSAKTLRGIEWPTELPPSHINQIPREGQYIHVYDRNSAYWAACTGRKFGSGDPVRDSNGSRYADNAYGLWCISATPNGSPYNGEHYPSPLPSIDGPAITEEWFYTPHIKLARKQGWNVTIHKGYIWEESHDLFDDWIAYLFDARIKARANGYPITEGMIKRTYNRTRGIWATGVTDETAPKWERRPDWSGTIVAESYLRMMSRVMEWEQNTPGYLAIHTDAIAWISDIADPALAIPSMKLSAGLGAFKHVSTLSGDSVARITAAAREGETFRTVWKMISNEGE